MQICTVKVYINSATFCLELIFLCNQTICKNCESCSIGIKLAALLWLLTSALCKSQTISNKWDKIWSLALNTDSKYSNTADHTQRKQAGIMTRGNIKSLLIENKDQFHFHVMKKRHYSDINIIDYKFLFYRYKVNISPCSL